MKLVTQIAIILGLSLAAFFLHTFILDFVEWENREVEQHHSLLSLYAGYSSFSIMITIILTKIRAINIDYVGYSFLLLTGLKMLLSFGVFYGAIHDEVLPLTAIEKKNILTVFLFFLAVETFIAVRILNSRQQ